MSARRKSVVKGFELFVRDYPPMALVILLTILFWAVIPCVITGWMFRERGWSMGLGFLLGIMSGPLGILAALVLILIDERRVAGRRGKAFRLYHHFPLVGRVHVSTVWMLAGVATFLCVWALGGVWYEFRSVLQSETEDGQASGRSTAKLQPQRLAPAGTPSNNGAQPVTKAAASAQVSPSASPGSPLLSGLASRPNRTAQGSGAPSEAPAQANQPAAVAAAATPATAQPDTTNLSAPASPAATQPAAPSAEKSPTISREAAISEVTRSLSSYGHRVHAAVSGEARSTTLSLSGATLTRDAGRQLLGNRRLRESLKAAGVRVVVMINGQESWTYLL